MLSFSSSLGADNEAFAIFVSEKYDFRVGHMEADMWSFLIKQDILDKHGNLGPHR